AAPSPLSLHDALPILHVSCSFLLALREVAHDGAQQGIGLLRCRLLAGLLDKRAFGRVVGQAELTALHVALGVGLLRTLALGVALAADSEHGETSVQALLRGA